MKTNWIEYKALMRERPMLKLRSRRPIRIHLGSQVWNRIGVVFWWYVWEEANEN